MPSFGSLSEKVDRKPCWLGPGSVALLGYPFIMPMHKERLYSYTSFMQLKPLRPVWHRDLHYAPKPDNLRYELDL